jgi:hypothetical protein
MENSTISYIENYKINDTLLTIIEDFCNGPLQERLELLYNAARSRGPIQTKNFFIFAYHACLVENEYYADYIFNQIRNIILPCHKKYFAAINAILKLTCLKRLQENEVYAELVKGQICQVPIGAVQEQQAIRSIQTILLSKCLQVIEQMDENLKYQKEIGLENEITQLKFDNKL